MGTRLINILTFTDVAAGAEASQAHLLSIQTSSGSGVPIIPDLVEFDLVGFDVVSCTNTTLTIINLGSAIASVHVRVSYDHSIQRAFGNVATDQLSPAPFVVRGAGEGATAEVVGKMIFDQAPQTVGDNASVVVDWESIDYASPLTVADIANNRFVVPIDGTYLISAMTTWDAAAATGTFRLTIGIDGTGSATAQQTIEAAGGNVARTNVVTTGLQLTAGQLITLIANQLTGDARDILFGEFTISRVGPGNDPFVPFGFQI